PMSTKAKQGFTLIELLIVIGILAVLATLTVLVLNPAELFKQARDSQRIADLDTIRDAIVYIQGTSSNALTFGVAALSTGVNGVGTCTTGTWAIYLTTCGANTSRAADGTGW